jgi:O-antigen biosynthesis protein
MHKVDIIVPTYNYGKYLDACLQSVLEQRYGDFQVLVIDNASEDNTEELMREWLKRDGRIKYVRNETNIGRGKSYIKAYTMTSAEYVLMLCADDLLLPGFLEKIVKNGLEKHPECTFGYSKVNRLTETGLKTGMGQFVPQLETGVHNILYHLCFTYWLSPSFSVSRRKVLDELRVYDRWTNIIGSSRLGTSGDQYQLLMLSTKGPAFVVNEREGIYRIHPESDSSKTGREHLLEEVFCLYDTVFCDTDVFPPDAGYIAQINKISRLMTSAGLLFTVKAMLVSPHTGPLLRNHLKSVLETMAKVGRSFRMDATSAESADMRIEPEENFAEMEQMAAEL